MLDYKAMYYVLFNSITNAVELLKEAQIQGEQIYIDYDDVPPIERKEISTEKIE